MKTITTFAFVWLAFCCASNALGVPAYSIATLGFTGPEHTRSDGYKESYAHQLNEAGEVIGDSRRYNGGSNDLGRSVWLYNGATTVDIGLTGPEHTASNGYKSSYANQLNEAGQVSGGSIRYNGGSTDLGRSVWLYNGATTVDIGLTGPEHTRNDGYIWSVARQLNEAGQVLGASSRYNGGSADLGQSIWFYDGTTTIDIGFTGPEYTRNDGYKQSYAGQLNEAGQVLGASNRYNGGNTDLGQGAWLYNGATTIDIGLTGPEHTRNDGYKESYADQLNAAGQVLGSSWRFNGGSTWLGQSVWLFNGTTTVDIGLTGPEHTRNDGYKGSVRFQVLAGQPPALNEVGQVIGSSARYNGGSTDLGQSAWLYNGTTTIDIGLTGPEHTSSDGIKYSDFTSLYPLNEAGHAIGSSVRYNGGSSSPGLGQSAWLYNGTTTIDIGLTGLEYTSNDGYKDSHAYQLNEAGQAIGISYRFNGGGSSKGLGQSAWLYIGTTTIDIGLTGPEYTRNDGYKYSEPSQNTNDKPLNEAGQVVGFSLRYNGGSTDLGVSAWLYNGTTTIDIGLTGPEYTRNDGYKLSGAYELNEAGQVLGYSERYNSGNTQLGRDAWFYDPLLDQTFTLQLSTRSDGYASSAAQYLGEDGLVLGTYTLFDSLDNNLGDRAFYFTIADGLHDLGALVGGGLIANGWDSLATVIHTNGLGQILGSGRLTSQSGGGDIAYYLLTPAVPEPNSVVLFLCGLCAFGWFASRTVAHQFRYFSVGLLILLATSSITRADIFRWNNGLLIPGTEGIIPGPGVHLNDRQLEYASLSSIDLTSAAFFRCNLTYADLAEANLTSSDFYQSTLTNANFAGAIVNGANFRETTPRGFTKEQLYSTASYQQENLKGIRLYGNDLTGWDLSGQDLTGADFTYSILTDANFAGASVTGTDFRGTTSRGFTKEQLYSTASYQQENLKGIRLYGNDLTGWDLSGQDLTNASFYRARLSSADFAGAIVTGVYFEEATARGFTKEQLYSTASYQQKNLQRIRLDGNDLTGWDLSGQDLTGARLSSSFAFGTLTNANLAGANLTNADLSNSTLTGANLMGTILTNANFGYSTLTDANFAGAIVTGAGFGGTTGFAKEQLYSTASYQQKNLQGIHFGYGAYGWGNDLTNWDLNGQDITNAIFFGSTLTDANFTGAILTNAEFYGSTLTDANFAGAIVTGAGFAGTTGFTKEQLYSTASYQQRNLQGIQFGELGDGLPDDLTGWDLSGQDLTNANLSQSTLTDTNLTGAIVNGTIFTATTIYGFTKEQLYSTASYQQKNLRWIGFGGIQWFELDPPNDLTGWDFSGQDLMNAGLFRTTLIDADLTAADLRGAGGILGVQLTGAIVRNTIRPDGNILGLALSGSDELVVRDDDGWIGRLPMWDSDYWHPRPPIPIAVRDHFAMPDGGVLRLIFESDPWDSLISFQTGIPITLGGTLKLTFASGTDASTQLGRTLRIFDWTGVTPTGTFSVASPYVWDLSRLYTSGDVTLLAIPEPTTLVLLIVVAVLIQFDVFGNRLCLFTWRPGASRPSTPKLEESSYVA